MIKIHNIYNTNKKPHHSQLLHPILNVVLNAPAVIQNVSESKYLVTAIVKY